MIILTPAYGRHYETFEQAQKDWKDGLDFRLLSGPYCSIRDLKMLFELDDRIVIEIDGWYKTIESTLLGEAIG